MDELNESTIAKGLYTSFNDSNKFTTFDLDSLHSLDDQIILELNHQLRTFFEINGVDQWKAISYIFEILSEPDRISIMETIVLNPAGAERTIIERNVKSKDCLINHLNVLVDANIVKNEDTKLLPGTNFKKAITCLEIIRNIIPMIGVDESAYSFITEKILLISNRIRTVVICDEYGKIKARTMKRGTMPKLTNQETDNSIYIQLKRWKIRKKFRPKMGECKCIYTKNNRITRLIVPFKDHFMFVTFDNEENEQDDENIYKEIIKGVEGEIKLWIE